MIVERMGGQMGRPGAISPWRLPDEAHPCSPNVMAGGIQRESSLGQCAPACRPLNPPPVAPCTCQPGTGSGFKASSARSLESLSSMASKIQVWRGSRTGRAFRTVSSCRIILAGIRRRTGVDFGRVPVFDFGCVPVGFGRGPVDFGCGPVDFGCVPVDFGGVAPAGVPAERTAMTSKTLELRLASARRDFRGMFT